MLRKKAMESKDLLRPLKPTVVHGEGEEMVINVLQSTTDAYYVLDDQWRFTFLNQAAKDIFNLQIGGDSDIIPGKIIWEVFPETRSSIIEQKFRQAVNERASVHFETSFEPWNMWFSARVSPTDEGGLSVYFRDISKDKNSAVAVADCEKKYKMLFTSMDEGFCIVDILRDENGEALDYRFLETNPAFTAHTGLADCIGRTIRELRPGHADYWQGLLGEVAATGNANRFTLRSDSLDRWFSGYAFKVNDSAEDGKVAVLLNDITQQKLTEENTRRLQSESRARVVELETLLSVLPIGIGIASDPDCRDIRSNPALAELLGVGRSDNASMTAPEEERPLTFRILDDTGHELRGEELPMQVAAREGKGVRGIELNIERSDGRTLRLLEYVAPLLDDNGQSRGSVGAFIDITERRKSEQRRQFLQLLDDTLRPMVDSGEIVAAAARLLGEHLDVDRCAYASVDADQDTMNITGNYCRDVPSIVGVYTFTRFGQEVLDLMRSNEPYVVEDVETHTPAPPDLSAYRSTQIRAVICVPLHKGGRLISALAVHQKKPRKWSADEVSLTQQVANRCWESIERTSVTHELQESNERFRLLADNMVQMAWMADSEGSVFWYNKRWSEFTGSPVEELQGWGWKKIHHPAHLERVTEKWRQHVSKQELWEDTFPMRGKDGRYRWFLGRALPVRSAEGQVLRWFGTHTDITDQMRSTDALAKAKDEAERANQAKDEFLAVLSHELRTPLTPVLLSVASMEEDEHVSDELRTDLAVIRRNIELEARLIDDLLDVTRIARGKMSLRFETCDLHAVIHLAVGILIDEIQEKRIKFSIRLDATHTLLSGDPARLQQVLWNLLKNSLKFTPSDGEITLLTKNNADGALVIEVCDTGIGMTGKSLEHIFRPFEQGGLANDHRFGGLGLGLSISKAIVDMHGGIVTAESAGLNLGSTFRIILPLSEQQASPSEKPVTTPSEIPANNPSKVNAGANRILLVEDHGPTLKVLSKLLRREGYDVTTADSVSTAQKAADSHTFDFIISDIGLPDGSGYDLMKSLRALHNNVPGIALTGYGSEDDHQRSKEAGFVMHLTKPVNFSQLKNALSVCFSK